MSGPEATLPDRAAKDRLIAAARQAQAQAYAPYSRFRVGAALLLDDGRIVTGANVENASYGLSLCAETVAVAKAMADGARGGFVAVAVVGGPVGSGAIGSGPVAAGAIAAGAGSASGSAVTPPLTPCGRCRQVLSELGGLSGTDPVVLCVGSKEVVEIRLSQLLPHAFGPSILSSDNTGG